MKFDFRRAAVLVGAAWFSVPAAHAVTLWTDWTAATTTTGASAFSTVSGSLSLGGAPVSVTYRGATDAVQLSGADWWDVAGTPDPYSVTGAPNLHDIIRLVGGDSRLHQISFSTAVVDPVIALLSVGTRSQQVDYVFDQKPILLSSGVGWWGGCGSCLYVNDHAVSGTEGHGVVQFKGSFTQLTWSVPEAENWHGFTVGATSVAPVSEPPATALLACGLLVGGYLAKRRSV
jgi:hypothetical protein